MAPVVYSKEVRGHPPQKLPEKQTSPSENQKPPAADNRGTEGLPLVVKTIPSEKSQQETEKDARDRDDKRWNDRATLGIALFTLMILSIQTFVFGLQAHRLNQTIKTMDRLGKDQSRDMQASLKIARSDMIASHRPWLKVDVTPIGPFEYCKNTASCMFKIIITNVGAAPAHRVLLRDEMLVGVSSAAIPAQRRIAEEVRSAADGFGPTLFPGEKLELGMPRETNLEGLKELNNYRLTPVGSWS